jgi:hypothetical protein
MAPTKKSTPVSVAPVAPPAPDVSKATAVAPVGKKAPAQAAQSAPTPAKAVVKGVTSEVPVVLAHTVPAPTPVPVVTAATVPVVPTVPAVPTDGAPSQDNVITTIIEKVNLLATNFKEVQLLLKVLSKDYEKQQKIIEKAQKKRQNAKNSPSGFAKPNKISDELCDFIGVPHGTEKSRTDITRFINAYVKEHNLNKPENKRFILPDDKLKKILNVSDKEEINYFILQKLISHHFPPSASKLAAAAAALKA